MLALPRPGRRIPVIPIAIGLAVAGVLTVIAVLAVGGMGQGDNSQPGTAASSPTPTPIPATRTPFPAPAEAEAVVPPVEATRTPVPAATATPRPVASPPRPASMIAFESDREGNNEIYTMNADGSNQTRLTFNDSFDVFPAWAP